MPLSAAPWRIVAGKVLPGAREAIIDRRVAEQSGIGLGATVEILGEDFTVTGLSDGTANLTKFGHLSPEPISHACVAMRPLPATSW